MNNLKLLLLVFGIAINAQVRAQLVEHYESPQRFMFSGFDNHNGMASVIWGGDSFSPNFNKFLSRRYTQNNSQRVIYGIAIPVDTRDLLYEQPTGGPLDRWNNNINYYDTSEASVIIGNACQSLGYDYEILSRTRIRIGNSSMIGNYFKMPDSDSARLSILNNSTLFPLVEVYFEQPQYVSDSFFVGCNLVPFSINPGGPLTLEIMCGPLNFFNVGDIQEYAMFTEVADSLHANVTDIPYYYIPIQSKYWCGIFPIVTPPPCMPPVFMKVDEHHRKGVTISWRVQYGTAYSEVEYGPQGFAEGTGTLVGPIAPDADFNGHLAIDSLQMDADYTVRLRSFCTTTGGYSDWAEMDFHTGSFYIVSTSVNSDTCGEVKGGGVFPTDTTIKLYAYPRNHKPFLNWSDGSTQNPRIVTVTRDTAFHAIFDCGAGTGGGTDGIETPERGQVLLTVSPNPAGRVTVVRCNVPVEFWELYDMKGCVMRSDTPASEEAIVDLSGLPPAVYILSAKTEYGYSTNKIIVR